MDSYDSRDGSGEYFQNKQSSGLCQVEIYLEDMIILQLVSDITKVETISDYCNI